MSSNVETLIEMGFPRNRAEKALHVTQYKSVQAAMDWLFAHNEDADIDDPFEAPKGHTLGESSTSTEEGGDAAKSTEGEGTDGTAVQETAAQAKSLKCDECGKKLRTSQDVQVHAGRTGHQSFSESADEIKPLTEEEKKEQMARLQDKIKERQKQKQELERKEAIDREKLRRKQGQETNDMKQKHEIQEMKKLADLKKREKMEDKQARQKVKDQIARDKAERAAKFSKTAPSAQVTKPPAASQAPPAAATPKKDYDSARIQIRLTNGSALTNSFKANESLAAVRLYIELNRTDGVSEPFALMTPFPRKVFTEEDMEKPLKELGLVPSAVITVTKPQ